LPEPHHAAWIRPLAGGGFGSMLIADRPLELRASAISSRAAIATPH
jgi:hypothetical protein